MTRVSLERDISPGSRLLLDSSALLAYLNGGETASPVAALIIDGFIKSGRNVALISAVSVMELLVRPLRHGAGAHHHVLNFIDHTPNLSVVPVDVHVALQAANIRAFLNFKPPDALVAACGIMAQVTCLVTNDTKWKQMETFPRLQFQLCHLEEYVPL